ncbi:hypothetical protein G4B88_021767 [Cannabis sativa]|uniref:Ubiquitin-like protease family profile domain-containing protein n=1 Tax=Cannabis sativa TaxID=3483 RepID=A0A7J6F1N1_CANSA|nr:hypothetical protein G4B88_021767 [Cannabis sativa]
MHCCSTLVEEGSFHPQASRGGQEDCLQRVLTVEKTHGDSTGHTEARHSAEVVASSRTTSQGLPQDSPVDPLALTHNAPLVPPQEQPCVSTEEFLPSQVCRNNLVTPLPRGQLLDHEGPPDVLHLLLLMGNLPIWPTGQSDCNSIQTNAQRFTFKKEIYKALHVTRRGMLDLSTPSLLTVVMKSAYTSSVRDLRSNNSFELKCFTTYFVLQPMEFLWGDHCLRNSFFNSKFDNFGVEILFTKVVKESNSALLIPRGKGKSPVKVLSSSGVAEKIPVNRIVELKLRNITPTSVERLSLSLTDFFSGETTPDAVKFKIKGGSKSVGQPGLMGASSSSAHENVSRVEFEEFKKSLSVVVSQQGILMKSVAEMNKKLDILIEPEQSQGGEENIDVDATIASVVKAVDNLIGSSTHVPASVETSEKTDLEMVVFQETPILRPQKRDRKKGAVFSVIYLLSTTTNVYCKGKDTIFPPFRFGVEDISNKMWFHNLAYPNCFLTNSCCSDHWICGRLNIVDRRIYLYNSLRSGRYMTAAKEACKPFSVILPYYFSMLDFKGLRNEAKFSTMEPFPIVAVDGLPEQVTADCGVFVASFAEYFIDGKLIPSSGFDVEIHRDRLAVLFYQYGMKKQLEDIESESEAPPSLPKNFSYPTSFNI